MEYKVRYQFENDDMVLTAFYGTFDECVNVAKDYIVRGYVVSIEPLIRV